MKIESKLMSRRYHYILMQSGSLPLEPDGIYTSSVEHRCTSILLWPEEQPPSQDNTILTDPCFTSGGYHLAVEQLERLNLSFTDIGHIFETHPHRDHRLNLGHFLGQIHYHRLQIGKHEHFAGITVMPYPGHAPLQRGLIFRSTSHQKVCVAGDAVLDEKWLRSWKYYWPNFYQEAEIIETWESVAHILSFADVIIPGHGMPIQVTPALLHEVLNNFPAAAHANACQQLVEPILQQRLARFESVRV
jgi:glyoxylase-like metal-dependent hydrolase (beta-lactamase superfamily II)